MELSGRQAADFGVALNEATLVAVDVAAEERRASLTLAVLALPVGGGPPPSDPRVLLILQPVGRIAASFRHGRRDDAAADAEGFELGRLADVAAGFDQQPIHGWEFLDVPEADGFATWAHRLSLDWRTEPGGLAHALDLFQESAAGPVRHLDLRLWFDRMRILGPDRREVAFDDFTSAGVRWWDGLYAGDPRTAGHGIVPAAPPSSAE